MGHPVRLLAARPLHLRVGSVEPELLGHGLPGEVDRALAHGRVAVAVDGPQAVAEEPVREVRTTALLAAPDVEDLVVLGPEVGMVGVDEGREVGGVLGLEVRHTQLLLRDLLGVRREVGQHLRVADRPELAEARDATALLAGDVPEEGPALDDLGHGLVEADRRPLVLAALPGALQHADDAIGVVGGLDARLALGAQRRVHGRGARHVGRVGDVRDHVPRRVGVPVDLRDDPVLDLHLDAALRVALLAHRVDEALGPRERVLLRRRQVAGSAPAQADAPWQPGRDDRRPGQEGRALDDVTPVDALGHA